MAKHHLDPAPRALHGYFSRELAPALTIDSGDVVSFQTLDSGWGAIEQEVGFSEPRDFVPRDVTRDVAHALAGPVAINGARAGMTLEIHINRIRAGRWGWPAGPGAPAQLDPHLGLGPGPGGPPAVITVPRGDHATFWELDPEYTGSETSANTIGIAELLLSPRARPVPRPSPAPRSSLLLPQRAHAHSASAFADFPHHSGSQIERSCRPRTHAPSFRQGTRAGGARIPSRDLRRVPRSPGIAGCCARAASGHPAAPPRSVMNSRRLIGLFPRQAS